MKMLLRDGVLALILAIGVPFLIKTLVGADSITSAPASGEAQSTARIAGLDDTDTMLGGRDNVQAWALIVPPSSVAPRVELPSAGPSIGKEALPRIAAGPIGTTVVGNSGNVQTKVLIVPSGGTVGTKVDVVITIFNPFTSSRIGNIRVEALKKGPVEFFPDTFQPPPAIASEPPADRLGSLVWDGLELAPNTGLEIRGQGRITGPRGFTVLASAKGKREMSVGGNGAVKGQVRAGE